MLPNSVQSAPAHHVPAPTAPTPPGTVLGHTRDGGAIVVGDPSDRVPPSNAFTPEEIAALESEHRRIGVIPSEHGDYALVIRSAKKVEWSMFKRKILDDDIREKAEAQEVLVSQCCIAIAYRGRKAFGKDVRPLLADLLDDYPAMPDQPPVTALIKTLNGDVGGTRSGK